MTLTAVSRPSFLSKQQRLISYLSWWLELLKGAHFSSEIRATVKTARNTRGKRKREQDRPIITFERCSEERYAEEIT
jgi:hypothetical protein